jgi:hypothetical protein
MKINYLPSFLISFNNLNSLQTYDSAQNYIILHREVKRLSQQNPEIWNHRHI